MRCSFWSFLIRESYRLFRTYLRWQKSPTTVNAGRASPAKAATDPSQEDSAWLPHFFVAWGPCCPAPAVWYRWHWWPGGPGRDAVARPAALAQEPAQIAGPSRSFRLLGGGFGILGLQSQQGWGCQVRGLEGFCPTWQFWMLLCKFFPCHSWIAEGLVGSTLITRVAASTGSSAAGGLESVWLRWLQAARLSPGMPTGLGAASSVAALIPFSFSQRRADACSSALQSFSVSLKTQKVFTATFNFRVYHSLLLLTKKQTWRSLTR